MALGRISGEMLEQNLNIKNKLTFHNQLLTLDSSNNRIGINTSTPNVEFDVVGTARANKLAIIGDLSMEWEISMDNNNRLKFMYNNVDKLAIDNNGSVEVEGTPLQEQLVSGSNIKTINGSSILGNGDLIVYGLSSIQGMYDVDFETHLAASTQGMVLTSYGDSTYIFEPPNHTNALAQLTEDVDFTTNTPSTTSGLVLTSDGDGTYSFQSLQTDAVSEGTNNLYYTDARVDARLASGSLGDVTIGGTVTADQYINNEARHSIRPSLLLDFANSKRLDPRITFSRASTGTYYDGKTFAKAEENLFRYSQSSAQKTLIELTITSETETAPDGTNTAFLLTEDVSGTGGPRCFTDERSFVSGLTYTFSAFFKKGTGIYSYLAMRTSIGNAVAADFNLNTGAINNTASNGTFTNVSANIISVGGGWYRCSVTGTAGQTVTNGLYNLGLTDVGATYSSGYPNITMSGRTIYSWGLQSEARDSVTAYTPTTTQPITNYIPVLQTAASGAARFDHDPITGESKGLLIEEQRTNLLTYSEDFANADWSKTNASVTSNIVVAPDGTLTGDKLVEDTTASNTHEVSQFKTASSASDIMTFSVYAKAAERGGIQLRIASATGQVIARFNLTNGTHDSVVSSSATNVSSSMEDVGNGWYRCIAIGNGDPSSTSTNCRITLLEDTSDLSSSTYTGDGYSGVYIWGAQLEEGAFPTSYIKTTSAQVTRNSDSASMTGTNFSSWYNPSAGSLYAEATTGMYHSGVNEFPRIAEINAGGNTNTAIRLVLGVLSTETDFRTSVVVNGDIQYSADSGPANGVKQIIAYKVDDFSSASNGNLLATDTSGVLPTVDSLFLGGNYTANISGALNGHIKKFAYYPKRLTNAELQTLTET